MNAAQEVRKKFGTKDVTSVMATPQNLELLSSLGLLTDEGKKASPADLIFAVKTQASEEAQKMWESFQETLKKGAETAKSEVVESYAEVLKEDAALVLVSIPGRYVMSEAQRALNAEKNVMIFSDNVSVEEEIKLKKLAASKNLLLMGPDCGTAIINGKGLGFANVVRRGNIGIVGASGSGVQEVTTIIHKLGCGVSHAVGVGGRDLKADVGGITTKSAMDVFEEDADTEVVLLISKPPAGVVADEIISKAKSSKKKYVINFLTLELKDFANIKFAATLEAAALTACKMVKKDAGIPEDAAELKKVSGFLRGLYSGGTLCYEALYLLKDFEIYSNIALNKVLKMEDPFKSFKNCLVDMGEDEFTRGYPHPMMDFTLRRQRILQEAGDRETGVILLDCALGWGCHLNPAGELSAAVAEAKKINPEIIYITSITGTDGDPQNYALQKKILTDAGVLVFSTNRQAVNAARKTVFGK